MTPPDDPPLLQSTLPTPHSTKSFWHREPSPILLGHRTTSDLPTEADVVIVGSGVAGAWAARWLVEGVMKEMEREGGEEVRVVMVEAREACWGATGRNGGHCQPKIYDNQPHIARFEVSNFQCLRSLAFDNGIECDWRDLWGCHGYFSQSLFATMVDLVEKLRSVDSELADHVTVVTPESKNPSLADLGFADGVLGAIIQKVAASLWPYKMVSWILEQLLSNNAAGQSKRGQKGVSFNLQTNTPVTRLQKLRHGGWVVHTPRGMMAAKKVLLATNAYTSHLLPEFSDLIVPVRGQMSALIPPPSLGPAIGRPFAEKNSYNFFGSDGSDGHNLSQDDYLLQRPSSNTQQSQFHGSELMFGGGRRFAANLGVGTSDDSAIDEPTASYLRQALTHSLDLHNHNQGEELKASHEWSGIMGFSRDGHPWVGPVPEALGGGEGLWICAGFTGHGMAGASLCAKTVAGEMMGDEVVDVPVEFKVSVDRAGRARALVGVEYAERG